MTSEEKIAYELNKRLKFVEETEGDYISYVLKENLKDSLHTMLIDEECDLTDVYKELSDLEKADLIDFWNKGRK